MLIAMESGADIRGSTGSSADYKNQARLDDLDNNTAGLFVVGSQQANFISGITRNTGTSIRIRAAINTPIAFYNHVFDRQFPAFESDTIFMGFALRIDGAYSNRYHIMVVGEARNVSNVAAIISHIGIRCTAANNMEVMRGGQAGTVLGSFTWPKALTIWGYLEIKVKIHATAGEVIVRVDGTTVLTLSNINTFNNVTGATGKANLIRHECVIGTAVSGANLYLDDGYVCNEVGGAPFNGFVGDIIVEGTTSANNSDSGPNTWAGSSTTSQPVGQHNQGIITQGGDQLYSKGVSTQEMFDWQPLVTVPATGKGILAVAAYWYGWKRDHGRAPINIILRDGPSGNSVVSPDKPTFFSGSAPSNNSVCHRMFLEKDLNGQPWTKAAYDNLHVGTSYPAQIPPQLQNIRILMEPFDNWNNWASHSFMNIVPGGYIGNMAVTASGSARAEFHYTPVQWYNGIEVDFRFRIPTLTVGTQLIMQLLYYDSTSATWQNNNNINVICTSTASGVFSIACAGTNYSTAAGSVLPNTWHHGNIKIAGGRANGYLRVTLDGTVHYETPAGTDFASVSQAAQQLTLYAGVALASLIAPVVQYDELTVDRFIYDNQAAVDILATEAIIGVPPPLGKWAVRNINWPVVTSKWSTGHYFVPLGENCDYFERASIGPEWVDGPLFNITASYTTEIQNSIDSGAWVAGENNEPAPTRVIGASRRVDDIPGTQWIEIVIGDMFQGGTPGMDPYYQIVEGNWYLFTQVTDTPIHNACIGLYIAIHASFGSPPDYSTEVYLELVSIDDTGQNVSSFASGSLTPIPNWQTNPQFKIRLETAPNGHSLGYVNDQLIVEDTVPPTGGTHVGFGSEWNRTNYDGGATVNNGTAPRAEQVCWGTI